MPFPEKFLNTKDLCLISVFKIFLVHYKTIYFPWAFTYFIKVSKLYLYVKFGHI